MMPSDSSISFLLLNMTSLLIAKRDSFAIRCASSCDRFFRKSSVLSEQEPGDLISPARTRPHKVWSSSDETVLAASRQRKSQSSSTFRSGGGCAFVFQFGFRRQESFANVHFAPHFPSNAISMGARGHVSKSQVSSEVRLRVSFGSFYELKVTTEALAPRQDGLNVPLGLGEYEALFASNISPCASLSTDLPRAQQSSNASIGHGLP